jgi:hypothetical protein
VRRLQPPTSTRAVQSDAADTGAGAVATTLRKAFVLRDLDGQHLRVPAS